MSAAEPAYGHTADLVVDDEPSVWRTVLPLLVLVIGLAAATVWFVALPALEPAPAKRSCEVIVLKSGVTKCVADPSASSRAASTG